MSCVSFRSLPSCVITLLVVSLCVCLLCVCRLLHSLPCSVPLIFCVRAKMTPDEAFGNWHVLIRVHFITVRRHLVFAGSSLPLLFRFACSGVRTHVVLVTTTGAWLTSTTGLPGRRSRSVLPPPPPTTAREKQR